MITKRQNICVSFFSFGGGPAVNHLYICTICQVEIETLAKRRKTEIDTFIKVKAGLIKGLSCVQVYLRALCRTLNERVSVACSWTKSFRLRRPRRWSCVSACSGSESGRAMWKAKTMVWPWKQKNPVCYPSSSLFSFHETLFFLLFFLNIRAAWSYWQQQDRHYERRTHTAEAR